MLPKNDTGLAQKHLADSCYFAPEQKDSNYRVSQLAGKQSACNSKAERDGWSQITAEQK